MGSALHLHQVPATGGDTLFASMYAAYDALSDTMKFFVSELTATLDGEPEHRGRYADRGVNDAGKLIPRLRIRSLEPTRRPVAKRYMSIGSSRRTSNDLSATESRILLDYLFAHCERPDFQCRFQWEANSVAFFEQPLRAAPSLVGLLSSSSLRSHDTVKGDRPV